MRKFVVQSVVFSGLCTVLVTRAAERSGLRAEYEAVDVSVGDFELVSAGAVYRL